ncbi:alpha/beta hydrolase [candidate division KSB1 bacterium]
MKQVLKNSFFMLIFLIIIIADFCYAQVRSESLRSEILGEDRPLYVRLPDKYENVTDRYPVLIVLDGNLLMHSAVNSPTFNSIIHSLVRSGEIPDLIVIGILNTDRRRDFTPTKIKRHRSGGGADKFIKFLKEELIPYVENTYRTGGKKILFGHSLGGLLTTYTFLTVPETFDAYIASSPSFTWDDRIIFKTAENTFQKPFLIKKTFLFYVGSNDMQDYPEASQRFAEMLEQKAPQKLKWEFKLYENEDHMTMPPISFKNGLSKIFSEWKGK